MSVNVDIWSFHIRVSKLEILTFSNVYLCLFSDYEGMMKASIIGGILLRESISISKVPMPTELIPLDLNVKSPVPLG